MYQVVLYAENVKPIIGAEDKYEDRIAEVLITTTDSMEDAEVEILALMAYAEDQGGIKVYESGTFIFFPVHRIIKIEARGEKCTKS